MESAPGLLYNIDSNLLQRSRRIFFGAIAAEAGIQGTALTPTLSLWERETGTWMPDLIRHDTFGGRRGEGSLVRMALRNIVLLGEPILRQKAKKVSRFDESIQQLIDDMIETMQDAPGVGLAAPQVGVPLRVITIDVEDEITVLVNPEIVEMEGEWEPEEGCLSIPGYVANVKRAEKVVVRAKGRKGKPIKIKADGLLAHVIQHEVDHLEGVLFIDRLPSMDMLRKVPPSKSEAEAEGAEQEAAAPVA